MSIGGIGEIGGNNYLYSFKGEQVIVDGGKGQLSSVVAALEDLKLEILKLFLKEHRYFTVQHCREIFFATTKNWQFVS